MKIIKEDAAKGVQLCDSDGQWHVIIKHMDTGSVIEKKTFHALRPALGYYVTAINANNGNKTVHKRWQRR